MDFTIEKYIRLLENLKAKGYEFITVSQYAQQKHLQLPRKFVILRHDVDKRPNHSLRFAKIQTENGIRGTYYFRAIEKLSWVPEIVSEIHSLNHETGYHYENLSICKGDMRKAIADFIFNLDKMRKLVPVQTICMHGSPMSRFDNRDLWKDFSYKEFEIICEPYFDVDFDKVFYLTDTGRRWNGERFSVRDKIANQETKYRSTGDIIKSLDENSFPDCVMMTFHPQRWNDSAVLWLKELLWQNTKNLIKLLFRKLE